MYIDALLQFDSGANLAQVVGTYTSANIIDLHGSGLLPTLGVNQGARDMGIGDNPAMKVHSLVKSTFTSGGAGTLQVAIQGAPDNGAGVPGAFTTYAASAVYALATLIAGARLLDIDMPRPPAGVAFPRFLRMAYIIAGATMTGGVVESELVLDRVDQPEQANATLGGYPAGITVAN